MTFSEVLVGWYGTLSALTFVAYGWDKRAAVRGDGRVPETTLHVLSLLGGWPGAMLGQRVFRHKTRKQPFRSVFWLTALANCIVLGALIWGVTALG